MQILFHTKQEINQFTNNFKKRKIFQFIVSYETQNYKNLDMWIHLYTIAQTFTHIPHVLHRFIHIIHNLHNSNTSDTLRIGGHHDRKKKKHSALLTHNSILARRYHNITKYTEVHRRRGRTQLRISTHHWSRTHTSFEDLQHHDDCHNQSDCNECRSDVRGSSKDRDDSSLLRSSSRNSEEAINMSCHGYRQIPRVGSAGGLICDLTRNRTQIQTLGVSCSIH